jgi:hypothetical protein
MFPSFGPKVFFFRVYGEMAGRWRYGRMCWMAMLAIACMHAARGEHSGSATYYEPPYMRKIGTTGPDQTQMHI